MDKDQYEWFDFKQLTPDDNVNIVLLIGNHEFLAKKIGHSWWVQGNPPHFKIEKWRYENCVKNVTS
jgi:hypothetical protein